MFLFAISATQLLADSAAEIDAGVDAALKDLLASEPAAAELSKIAKGILVYPDVWKAGLLVGGKFGEGPYVKGARPLVTTIPLRFLMACKRACKNSGTHCFLSPMKRLLI